MKRLTLILEKVAKLCAAVLVMEITAYVYSGIRYGFNYVSWSNYIDLVIGYPLILAAVYAVFHAEELYEKIKNLMRIRTFKPNLIVTKGGNIEGH